MCFEYVPALLSDEERSECVLSADAGAAPADGRASLVWVGDPDDRPRYLPGQATGTQLTAKMDSALWTFAREKRMDERMFRALVEGRLPPKEPPASASSASSAPVSVTTQDGTTVQLDPETLAQAALLQKMKASFGQEACLEAMMKIMKQAGEENRGKDNQVRDESAI